jgi:hypothetical protein
MIKKVLFITILIVLASSNLTKDDDELLIQAKKNFKKHLKIVYEELHHFG